MQCSDQALLLATWNTMISQRYNSNDSVERYILTIQDCVKTLDSCGFSWKKEAIIGMIIRIGLANEPLVYQDLVKKFQDVCHQQQQQQHRRFHSRLSLWDLPVEIIDRIIEFLHLISLREANAIKQQKFNRLLRAVEDGDMDLPPELPILNSLQTFAVVNKAFYERCRPWLWKVCSN